MLRLFSTYGTIPIFKQNEAISMEKQNTSLMHTTPFIHSFILSFFIYPINQYIDISHIIKIQSIYIKQQNKTITTTVPG
jgi:hypothetical protein